MKSYCIGEKEVNFALISKDLRGYFRDVGNFGKLKTHANSFRITNAILKFDTQITLTTERQN